MTTEAAIPSKVRRLQIQTVGSTSVTIAWDPPTDGRTDIQLYEILYWQSGHEINATKVTAVSTSMAFSNLQKNTEYVFKVK